MPTALLYWACVNVVAFEPSGRTVGSGAACIAFNALNAAYNWGWDKAFKSLVPVVLPRKSLNPLVPTEMFFSSAALSTSCGLYACSPVNPLLAATIESKAAFSPSGFFCVIAFLTSSMEND